MFCLSGIICFVCLDWYVLSIWIDMFCLSGMICFVYLEWYVLSIWNDMLCLSGLICFVYLDWYVLSIWIDMFCVSGMICFFLSGLICSLFRTYQSRQTEHINPDRKKRIIPDRQNISIQIDKTYHST
jgi:hypothetical protein